MTRLLTSLTKFLNIIITSPLASVHHVVICILAPHFILRNVLILQHHVDPNENDPHGKETGGAQTPEIDDQFRTYPQLCIRCEN